MALINHAQFAAQFYQEMEQRRPVTKAMELLNAQVSQLSFIPSLSQYIPTSLASFSLQSHKTDSLKTLTLASNSSEETTAHEVLKLLQTLKVEGKKGKLRTLVEILALHARKILKTPEHVADTSESADNLFADFLQSSYASDPIFNKNLYILITNLKKDIAPTEDLSEEKAIQHLLAKKQQEEEEKISNLMKAVNEKNLQQQHHLNMLKVELSKANKKQAEQEAIILASHVTKMSLRTEIEKAKIKETQATSHLTLLQSSQQTTLAQIQTLQSQLHSARLTVNENAVIQEQLTQKKREAESLHSKATALVSEKARLAASVNAANQELDILAQTNATLQNEIAVNKNVAEGYQQELQKTETEYKNLVKQMTEMQAALQQKDSIIRDLPRIIEIRNETLNFLRQALLEIIETEARTIEYAQGLLFHLKKLFPKRSAKIKDNFIQELNILVESPIALFNEHQIKFKQQRKFDDAINDCLTFTSKFLTFFQVDEIRAGVMLASDQKNMKTRRDVYRFFSCMANEQQELIAELRENNPNDESTLYLAANLHSVGFQRITRITLLCENVLKIVDNAIKKIPLLTEDTKIFVNLLLSLKETFSQINQVAHRDNIGVNKFFHAKDAHAQMATQAAASSPAASTPFTF